MTGISIPRPVECGSVKPFAGFSGIIAWYLRPHALDGFFMLHFPGCVSVSWALSVCFSVNQEAHTVAYLRN